MTDSKNGLDKLIAPCQRSVQCSCCPLHNPFGKKSPIVVSSPIQRDLPATIGAAAIIVPKSHVKQNVPSSANASRSTISRNFLPRADSCPPFLPSLQPPMATSLTACMSRETHELSTPIVHALSGQESCKDGTTIEPAREIHMHYGDLPWRTMNKELKGRGLLCSGLNVELAKRLEKDDKFQANARTAEDYNTMESQDIAMLCISRSIPSTGTDSMLRDRLKAHDKRRCGTEAAGPRLSSSVLPSLPVPVLEHKGCQDMLKEKPLVLDVKDRMPLKKKPLLLVVKDRMPRTMMVAKITSAEGMLPSRNVHEACNVCRKSERRCIHDTKTNEGIAEILTPAKPKKSPASQQDMKSRHRPIACGKCRKGKRRCTHGMNSNEDPTKEVEPVVPGAIKDTTGLIIKIPALAVEDFPGTRAIRSRVLTAKASASQSDLSNSAQTKSTGKDAKRKENAPKSRKAQLLYQPKDEISLLQICIKLKDVVAWGHISGFWTMVQDTLQLETGKPYDGVGRHVRLLVQKRRAEHEEIEQQGRIAFSRLNAGCRPLLDKWIAGGNPEDQASPMTSIAPDLDGNNGDVSLDEERMLQPNSDDSAVEVKKRSATAAWLEESCDTTRGKKTKLCSSELSFDTSKSSTDNQRCWSLSGSSATSDSSVEDDSEADN